MKNTIIFLSVMLIVIPFYSQSFHSELSNQIIIKFKKEFSPSNNMAMCQKTKYTELTNLNSKFNMIKIRLTGQKSKYDSYLLTFEKQENLSEIIDAYLATQLFDYVEPNAIGYGGGKKGMTPLTPIIPNDTYFSRQYGLYNDGTFAFSTATVDADVDMDLAWEIEQGSDDVIVAVLDSGNKLDHPEFEGRIWQNQEEVYNGIDDDNNGFIDDVNGWDFANEDNDPIDDQGHGTNVAGIIGANGNNDLGYAGVDWNCKIMVCKILDDENSGYYSWWIDAIYYAVDNGANVINMSVGGSSFSQSMQDAVDYAFDNGVTIVACMMNEDNDVTYYPAGYENTIAVGATNPNDQRASPFFWSVSSGSNFGNHIDVVAPGNYIYGLDESSNTNYNSYWGGTSQATPLVAGICALLVAQDPSRTPTQIKNKIIDTAEDMVGHPTEDDMGFDIYYGHGRVNAHQALLGTDVSIANDENLTSSTLSIYPIPSSEIIHITSENRFSSLRIYNALGELVFAKNTLQNSIHFSLNIATFARGIYWIKTYGKNNELIESSKFAVE